MDNNEGTTNDSTYITRRAPRARTARARIAAAIMATTALTLLTAACSSSPSSTGASGSSSTGGSGSTNASDSSSSPSAVSYSNCMRSHGVPNYPDPSGGQLPKGDARAFGVSSSVFTAARSACQSLLPNAGSFQEQASQCSLAGNCPPAVVAQMMAIDRKFAQCMRSHGVPNWPDPIIDHLSGIPSFRVSKAGITHAQTHSAPMSNTIAECQRLEGATLTFGLS
jgi:hypothetical protein